MIKNFIYLDSEKLRSFSSQLFEGVTEQIILTSKEETSTEAQQKGPVASGRILADIFSQGTSSSELRFMEDYAYTLFEKKLSDDSLIDIFSSSTDASSLPKSFISVTAKLRMNDISVTSKMLKNFNDFGEAFWRVTNESMKTGPGTKKILPDPDVRKLASEQGLQFNKKVSDASAFIMDFGFQDLLEANMEISGSIFSAPLKREFLRDREEAFIQKYSRISDRDFTIVGLVTQRYSDDAQKIEHPDVAEADGIKEAMRSMSLHLSEMEKLFSGPSKHETIIDPIAIYSVI